MAEKGKKKKPNIYQKPVFLCENCAFFSFDRDAI